MRNMNDEEVKEISILVVADHLRAGIEFLDITETVDESFEDEEETPTDEDYRAVATEVERILAFLTDRIDSN